MKKLLALLMAVVMILAVSSIACAEILDPDEADYDPNPDYAKYVVVEYYIEGADATVIVTCNANEDETEFCMEYSFYGDDQKVVCDAEGNIIFDLTGFMAGDTPDMIKSILEDEDLEWLVPGEGGEIVFFDGLTPDDAEYDPNPDYDKWTVIEYYIEGADATVVATVSTNEDESEFCMEYSFYGDDQKVICDAEGNVSFDLTGFMGGDTPDMVAYVIENAIWAPIGEGSEIEFADGLTPDDAEYDPNPDYDKWTVIEYYIEGADATVVATVSANEDETEFCMEYSFYGDDQKVVCDAEGNVSFDLTGFMGGDTPDMVAYVIENAVWAPIA